MGDEIVHRQVAIRESLIQALGADLVGPMAEDEVLASQPSRWYLTGFLVPSGAPEEQRVDALADEAIENEVDAQDSDQTDDDVRVSRSFLPSSMGLSFFVPADVDAVEVVVSWGDYTQLDEESTREWRAKERESWRTAPSEEEGDLRYRYWARQRTFAKTLPVDLTRSAVSIDGAGGAYLRVVVRDTAGAREGAKAVSLFLVNGREPAETKEMGDEQTLFHAALVVRCKQGFLPRHRGAQTDHADDRRNDLQFRNHAEWAVGHGVATDAVSTDDGCHEIRTTWLPTVAVHRMKATDVPGAMVSMEALASAEASAVAAGLRPLLDAYREWIQGHRGNLNQLAPERQTTASELMDEAELALERMSQGIALLEKGGDALTAFRIANAAMAAAARVERDGEPKWHLFQLAFLLLNLSGASNPHHIDRDRVDLLFFPTGGGKTEAYLGVAAFVLALRRIRGRERSDGGAGVAVLLRYTLRLLTLDQLRRAAQLVCALELQRRAQPELLGDFRFSIGLWVGRSGSANRMKDVLKPLQQFKEQGKVRGGPPPVPLASCPWCKTALEAEFFEVRPSRRNPKALVVGCANLECPFGFQMDPDAPEHRDGLPVVVVDEQVYSELPSIVVGTVDKFASLPWRGAVGMLFGRVKAEGEYGFLGAHEKAPSDTKPLGDGLLPPELIIQDELHLISGPLGTMVGLYETAIDALCRDRVGYGPKIIASTATARRASEQIRALFARPHTHLFPPQGVEAGDTFFAALDKTPEKTRLYVGVAAPGRSSKVVAARTYTTLLAAAQKQWHESGPPGAKNPADTYMTLACYFNALKELGGAQRLVQEDVAQRTEQMDQRKPLNADKSTHFERRRLGFDVLELTSRQSTDDIAQAIALLSEAFGQAKIKTDVLLASSMISVGVDIGRLGLMVVNGQPKTTAEYIQASSRVGRQTPGLVVTTLNLYKPRDRSHFERFQAYHQSFYREVEAASVTPFSARAIDRGLAGLVVGLVRHLGRDLADNRHVDRIRKAEYDPLEEEVVRLLTERALAHRNNVPPSVAAGLKSRVTALVSNWKLLVEGFQQAAKPLRYSSWEEPKQFKPLLSTAVDELTGEQSDLLENFRAPTSMRDVEPAVHVWVDLPRGKGAR